MAHISDCRFDFIIALVVCEHVLQIIKQFRDCLQLPSHYLVQATVEAETIVKILRDERGDDNVYQALCVEADSPFHYWKFALYNVFVDNILEELEDQSIVPKPTFTAHLLLPTNMHKMAADDQLIIKHAYEPDINGDAFDMECRPWKARCFDDHIGCFGCPVVSKHLFHSDCTFDDSSDHCHCWKIFQLHEKNQNISSSYHDRYQA